MSENWNVLAKIGLSVYLVPYYLQFGLITET